MEIDKRLTDKANELAIKHGLKLFSISWTRGEKNKLVLEVILDKLGGIGVDDIALFSQDYSDFLDTLDNLPPSYELDCSSPGAERYIEKNELAEHIDEYCELTLVGRGKLLGYIREVNPPNVTFEHFIKGRRKKEEFNFEQISKIQLRIKI